MGEQFTYSGRFRKSTLILVATGLVMVIIGWIAGHEPGERLWASLLLNTVYFNAIAVCGLVFVAVHIISDSGWHISIQRIPEAMSMYLPLGALVMLIILAGLAFDWHHLYHWAHPEEGDVILEGKKAFLNVPFFIVRSLVYLSGWIGFAWMLRKISLLQDQDPDAGLVKKAKNWAAWFVVFFAITSSTSAWDWLMSIDAHWFSTLYGWYVFSGLFVSGTAVIILIVLLLRRVGLLPHVNHEHLHDLGKYLFAFSIFWMYLWFSQYLLIWYGNLPEETVYFVTRMNEFRGLFYTNLVINFLMPFLVLMPRNSKRITTVLGVVAFFVFVGHWIDFYLMVMPGTVGENAAVGFTEIGMTVVFSGIFLSVVFRALSRASLVPKKHPYYEESLTYHTQY